MSDFDPTKKSTDAEAMSDYLETVNDVLGGIKAIQRNWKKYAVKFPYEREERFELRKQLSVMTNVFKDVTESLASKPFQREVTVKNETSAFAPLIEDIDGQGNNLSVFAGDTFYRGITDSITWIRVDYPDGKLFNSREEERQAGVRPYWVRVPHYDIIDVQSERSNGGEQLTYVRMWEDKSTIIEMWPASWKRWKLTDEGWRAEKEGAITIGEIPLVPYATGRRHGRKWQFLPPLLDALNAQIELMRKESDKEFAEVMTCFPMLSANGVSPAKDANGEPLPLKTGPNAVLYAPMNANGQAGSWSYVEPTTASLKHLSEQIEIKIQSIREIGKQPLTAQSGNLTRISALAASNKANSAVQQWALGLKDALENAMRITAKWLNETQEPEVEVYTDFRASDDDDTTPALLLQMRAAGDLSQQTLYREMKRLGRLSDDFDPEEEQIKIAEDLSKQYLDESTDRMV